MKKFTQITDFSTDELYHILDRADDLYDCWHSKDMPESLANKNIALWFPGNGFRNRMAFEIGAQAMGAHFSFVPGELGINEPLEDVGHYLNNWFDLAVVRAKKYSGLMSLASDLQIPLINARTEYNHPCEILGDLQYIRRVRGTIEGLHIVFIGEVTNLCMSWCQAALRFSIKVTQVAPVEYLLLKDQLAELRRDAKGELQVSEGMEDSIDNTVDVIYTDCWPKDKAPGKIRELFLPYQVTQKVLDTMKQDGFFLPCPPVTRGEELSANSADNPLCKNYEAKEFLLHSQNAIMEYLCNG